MLAKLSPAFIALVAAAAFAANTPALAGPPGATREPSVVVRYHDLDLSTSTGIRTLYARIEGAAFRVCEQIEPPHNGPTGFMNAKCRQTLVDIAVDEVNKPALTALHASVSGKVTSDLTARR